MKIGYPCINRTLECSGNKTFRLKSYSEERLIQTLKNNLSCLKKMLEFNVKHNILFFRISSDLVPFASHPICTFNWQEYFKEDFKEIGKIIKQNNMRISMHPDQFIVLNSIDENVVHRSVKELFYHAEILDLLELDTTAKIQLHVGGAYGDKERSINRFVQNYNKLDKKIKRRLVVENDDRIYSVKDCLSISKKADIPILFDVFHHDVLNNKETVTEALNLVKKTWNEEDGIPMIDYSSQEPNMKVGKHAETINITDFKNFIQESKQYDFDVMLEIKDKEKSAVKAINLIKNDIRFYKKHQKIIN